MFGNFSNNIGLLSRPFNLKYFDRFKKNELPWHKTLFPVQGYDIWALHSTWNKSAVRNEKKINLNNIHFKFLIGF